MENSEIMSIILPFLGLIGVIFGFLLSQFAEIVKSESKRSKILKALYAQADDYLQRIQSRNKTATEQLEKEHLVPVFYPTSSFESAFLSANGISAEVHTIKATIEYLDKANDLNSTIRILRDTFYMPKINKASGSREQAKRYLYNQVHDETSDYSMSFIISKLRKQIDMEQKQNLLERFIRDIL